MHVEAYDWVQQFATTKTLNAIEFGAKDINGSIQPLFPNATWTGVDIAEGPRVDVVADASTYEHPEPVDLIVCCEVFEHTPVWPEIIKNAYTLLASSGEAIFTCAGRGRPPHSAIDGLAVRPDEYYKNVDEKELERVMVDAGFKDIVVDWLANPGDVRAYGKKP